MRYGPGGLDTLVNDDVFADVDLLALSVTTGTVDGVKHVLRRVVQALTETVVLALVVVVSHVRTTLVVAFAFAYFDLFVKGNTLTACVALLLRVLARVGRLVLPPVPVVVNEWGGVAAVLTLGYVDVAVEVNLLGLATIVLAIVDAVLYVDLRVGVVLVGWAVARWTDVLSVDVTTTTMLQKIEKVMALGNNREVGCWKQSVCTVCRHRRVPLPGRQPISAGDVFIVAPQGK